MQNGKGALPDVLTPQQVHELIEGGAELRLLDVRTPMEYESVRIAGAYNVPLDMLGEHCSELRDHVREPIILICQSGVRARRAEAAMREAGLRNVHVMDGGMVAWQAAGLAAVRGRQRWGMERQVRLVAGSLVTLGALGSVFVAQPLVWLAAAIGAGLVFSAVTNTCGMALLLAKLPYNRGATCDVREVLDAMKTGATPGRSGGGPAPQCG